MIGISPFSCLSDKQIYVRCWYRGFIVAHILNFMSLKFYSCQFYINTHFLHFSHKNVISRFPLTLSDPGYLRQLTIRGGFKSPPPPYDLENCCVNLHHIIHVHFTRCFRHVPIGIFKKFAILTILQRFQNKK